MNVLILGANSDVAESLAHLLADKGHELVLAGRSIDKLSALKSDLEIRYGIICSVLMFDAEKIEEHETFYDSIDPKPDWVICAFGLLVDQDKANANANLAFKSYIVNMLGAISILDIVANDFAKREAGIIVGISSVAGDRGRGSNYTYGASKAGFSAYLSGLRNRLFKHNVHVVSIKPGFINSKMTAHLDLPDILTAKPKEVASAIIRAIEKKKNIVYVKWYWRYIMLIIRLIPEGIFKRLNL